MVSVNGVMMPWLLALGGVVLGLSWWLTRYLCSPTSKLLLLDHPNERSLHARPIPRTGGLAIVAGATPGFLAVSIDSFYGLMGTGDANPGEESTTGPLLWILGPALALAAVSFWDDRKGLSPSMRFGCHLGAAVAAALGGDLALQAWGIPAIGDWSFGWLAYPVTVLFIMWMTNLYNFMDGMDGLAGGMAVMGFGVIAALAWMAEQRQYAGVALTVAVAAGGYLAFNFPPARIFMGDVGSVTLGFLAGTLSLLGVRQGVFDLWIPLIVFSPFVVDATATLVKRLFRGERVWLAHREHYYQRLALAGWGHRKTLLAECVLMTTCVISAFAYAEMGELTKLALLDMWATIYVALAWGVRLVERR